MLTMRNCTLFLFLAAFAVACGNEPDEKAVLAQFRNDRPEAVVVSVDVEEQEVIAVVYRVTYRKPGVPETMGDRYQYMEINGKWRLASRQEHGKPWQSVYAQE
jgi:hypothetical protein